MIWLMQMFVRLTGYIAQLICFRTKIVCEDRKAQSRFIHGGAIIVSNHTAVYDYAVMLFVFFTRTLRYQMAEVLFKKQPLGTFLKAMGGVYIDRYSKDMGFMDKSLDILAHGGVVGVFPEGRLPKESETPPIEFKPGAAYLSIKSGVKIIPVYTNGSYFNLKRAKVAIGTPLNPEDFINESLGEKQSVEMYTNALRQKVIALGRLVNG